MFLTGRAVVLTAVRAIAPVAGIPPNKPDAIDASPCPKTSRSGSTRREASAWVWAVLHGMAITSAPIPTRA